MMTCTVPPRRSNLGLGVEHIVVMGHASCGGIGAFARGKIGAGHKPLSPGDFIGKWISLVGAAAARIERGGTALDEYIDRLALASIIQGLANLRTFPWIAAREREGTLALHGAYFGISSGALLALDEGRGQFKRVAAAADRAAAPPDA
jgi:carbonic anhydrase